ncbi:MAG: prolipoprotein diacylglyceryl transferase family protein [Nocardioidaceae bacterium]
MVVSVTLIGFVGAKLYYLAENAADLSWHHLGGSGFTWYGGFVAGLGTAWFLARRHRLPLAQLGAVSAAPLSLAYAVGRLGCLLAGDGTYGRPTDLPWAMTFPNGTVPTTIPVHPTPAYEAIGALAIAGLLWAVRRHVQPLVAIGIYAVLSGTARFLVEVVRVNERTVLGLTQPQLWSLVLITLGAAAVAVAWRRRETSRLQTVVQPVALVDADRRT